MALTSRTGPGRARRTALGRIGQRRVPQHETSMHIAGNVKVGCSISDIKALKRVLTVIEAQGARAVALTPPEILSAVTDRRIDALVYDLEPGDASALSTVRQARRVRRELPIWLYYPLRRGMSGLVAEAGSLPGVWTFPQMAGELW